MIALPSRILSVTQTPLNIRKAPAFPGDPTALPVTFSVLRYASGGATIALLGNNPFSRGFLTVVTNPADAETIAVNGVSFTFKTSPGAGEVQIGATREATATNLANVLNASASGSITPATYSAQYGSNIVNILYDTPGNNNAYSLANSSAGHVTRSGATLTGGQAYADGLTIDSDADYNSPDQSLALYVAASADGPTSLDVTDFQ